jgi:hypothetical protein
VRTRATQNIAYRHSEDPGDEEQTMRDPCRNQSGGLPGGFLGFPLEPAQGVGIQERGKSQSNPPMSNVISETRNRRKKDDADSFEHRPEPGRAIMASARPVSGHGSTQASPRSRLRHENQTHRVMRQSGHRGWHSRAVVHFRGSARILLW